MTFLRKYQRVAHTKHWCDRCCDWIQPGDYYEGVVQISKGGGLIVFKFHIDPSCDYPPDPFDDDEISKSDYFDNEFLNAA